MNNLSKLHFIGNSKYEKVVLFWHDKPLVYLLSNKSKFYLVQYLGELREEFDEQWLATELSEKHFQEIKARNFDEDIKDKNLAPFKSFKPYSWIVESDALSDNINYCRIGKEMLNPEILNRF